MANPSLFNQTSYYRINGGCDRYLIENYLLPGLETQGRIAAGSRGVELPSSTQSPEYISLDEAKKMVVEYLDSTENLLTKDKRVLLSINSFAEFARYAQLVYSNRIADPHKLLNATRISNLETYRKQQQSINSAQPSRFDTGKAFDEYNRLYFKLLRYSQSGVPGNVLSTLVPNGLDQNQHNLTKTLLAQIICKNFDRLYSAGSVGDSDERRDFAVTKELFKIIKEENPDASGLLNFINDRQAGTLVRNYVNRIKVGYFDNSSTPLSEYKRAQVAASTSSTDFIPGQQALLSEIKSALPPNLSQKERDLISESILTEITMSSAQQLTSDQLLILASKKVSKKLGLKNLDAATLLLIKKSLRETGLDSVIEYRQNEMSLLVNGHALTRAELKLIKLGINPFYSFKSKLKLGFETNSLINEYNQANNLSGNSRLTTLKQLEEHELNSPSPNIQKIRKIRSLSDYEYYYKNLTPKQARLLKRTQFGRFVLELRSGLTEAQRLGWEKWFDFESIVTGKKLHEFIYSKWDEFSTNFSIPGTKIPLFKIFPWVTDQLKQFKKSSVKSIISSTKTSTGFGSLVNWSFRQYELGGYTYNGALAHIRKAAWSSAIKWGIAKVGLTSVFKYSGVSVKRTVTRLLLKLGGRSLARAGSKTVLALFSALSGVGIALTVVFAIQTVIELFKLGWGLLKEFISNSNFRESIILGGAAIGAVLLGIPAAILGFFTTVSGLISGAFINLLVAFVLSVSLPFITSFTQNNIKNTFRLDVSINLDSGLGEFIGNILCNSGEGGGQNNSRIQTAACIAEILSKCSINPLTASNAQGSTWQCMLASTLAQSSLAALQYSATNYSVLQCVGFIVAIDVANGGTGTGFGDAKTLLSNPPSGYKPVLGVGSCSPGDFFVDTTGTWGHTGIFIKNGGATSQVSDANGAGPGVVRGPGSGTWLSSKIAGCLKKI
ncbi:hypothetical protein KBD69_00770 [Candidatus Woesebacteria bacterium]|nr:hypothetical protein [Candidatus Woesebacteria bacterium]